MNLINPKDGAGGGKFYDVEKGGSIIGRIAKQGSKWNVVQPDGSSISYGTKGGALGHFSK